MSDRSIYLAKHRAMISQRAHFTLFIPDTPYDRADLSQTFLSTSTIGTIIHVIGEPVMNGYQLEFKRNYDCSTSRDLQELVRLGSVQATQIFVPSDSSFRREFTPRSPLERQAAQVQPPPGGQNVRSPIDGVNTKRCQEWTMEYLRRLVSQGLMDEEAVEIAQRHRDPPTVWAPDGQVGVLYNTRTPNCGFSFSQAAAYVTVILATLSRLQGNGSDTRLCSSKASG